MRNKKRIPPSGKIRKEIVRIRDGRLTPEESDKSQLDLILHKAKLLIAQEILETEIDDFLGRGYYQRDKSRSSNMGYRNGYEPKKLRTPEGIMNLAIPQVRNTLTPFQSRVRQFFKSRSEVLNKLAVEMYVGGLSTQDIEDAFYITTGDRLLSKSSISRVTEILWDDYEAFTKRDLSKYEVVYLIVDAVYESLRPYIKANEGILACYGVCQDGRKVLLHAALGNKENYEAWLDFFRNMVKRGLNTPVAITSDGAPGLIKAADEAFPKSLRLRCWVHKMRNLAGKVPMHVWELVKSEIAAIRDSSTYEEGSSLFVEFVNKYHSIYPSLTKCILDDKQALLDLLKTPYRHRVFIRSTNLIERTFAEERRRTKVIPQFFSEKSCLKLVFTVLYRASLRWRRMPMGKHEIKELVLLTKKLNIKLPTLVLLDRNTRKLTSHMQRKRRILAEIA